MLSLLRFPLGERCFKFLTTSNSNEAESFVSNRSLLSLLGLRWLFGSPVDNRLRRYGRFGLKALRIAASTVALIELLRTDWIGATGGSLAWFLFVQVERRLADEPEADS